MAKKKYTNRRRLNRSILYFIGVIIALVAIFPKEAKFKFEFYKGKPWLHKELIAPFSFAVKKTDEQIQYETDSLKRSAKKVFVWNNSYYQNSRKTLLNRYFQDNQSPSIKAYVDSLLEYFGHKYIIKPEQLELLKKDEIILVKGKEREVFAIQNLYTPKKVYLELQQAIKDYKIRLGLLNTFTVLDNIEFENYLIANIELNDKLANEFLNERIQKISPTKGLVQKGELIIGAGKIIHQKDYEILVSFKDEYQKRHIGAGSFNTLLGTFLIIFIPFALIFLYLFQYHKRILMNPRKSLFLLITSFVFIGFSALNHHYDIIAVSLLPVIIYPVLVRTFLNTPIAGFSYTVILLLISYLVPNSFKFYFVQLAAGVAGIYTFPQITKRSHLFNTSFLIMLVYSVSYIGLSILQDEIMWDNVGLLAINSLLLMLTYPLVFLSEKLFGFTSDVTLMELSDTNHKLLKELSEKTPGTFQHSLQVANIAEELIRNIGGNPLLVRAGALYHDVGKLENPEYFTENQFGGYNPHKELTPLESARIIIQHVEDGIKKGKSYNLPQAILDFIPMHQGTMATKYFLTIYKQTHSDFDESVFHYPGPTPNSKETAVVMIADSIEAASRSLKSYTKENIEELVNRIVDTQLNEGQFENVNMTFKDITTIKRVLVDKLGSIYHSRVAYPKEKKSEV